MATIKHPSIKRAPNSKHDTLISGLEPFDYVTAMSEAWQFLEYNEGENLGKYCFERHNEIYWRESTYTSAVEATEYRQSENGKQYSFAIFVPSGKPFEYYLKAFAWGYYMWYSGGHDAMGWQHNNIKDLIAFRKYAEAFANLFTSVVLSNGNFIKTS